MSKSKVLIGAAFVLGGLLGLVPLFTLDKDRLAGRASFVSQGTTEAAAAPVSGDSGLLGSFGGKQVQMNTLNGSEAQKLYEAEMQVYTAAEQILVQRYVMDFFEKMKAERKLASADEAQAAYFADKVKVSEAEVKDFLEANKDNPALQRIPQDQRGPQVKNYLEGRAREGAFRELIDEAKASGAIRVAVRRPKEPKLEVDDGGNFFVGPKDAKVTIVEFADFQCPFCARMVPTLNQIVKKYEGKVRWVYRDFPLREIHPEALPAAVAANCAGEQGKYFEMHHALFENYQTLGAQLYKDLASKIGVDAGKFETCMKDPKQENEVLKDAQEGQNLGINGTPAYFVNGRKLGGAVNEAEFSRLIDEELAKK
ncbi:MAG: DsbA family protein [Betaproteobacteria bacterium]|nr:DsbA family protein [Betaproteobacteria bacterium]